MNEPIPTPRTDAGAVPASNIANDCAQEWVTVNLARTIERELAAMTENRDAAVLNFTAERAAHDRTLAELSEARERCTRMALSGARDRNELSALWSDKERLDWLIEKATIPFLRELSDYPNEARAAIDAARAPKPSGEPRNYTHSE